MTLQTVLAWSIGRSLIITTLALPLAMLTWQYVSGRTRGLRVAAMVIAVTPLFVPDLLIGFTYRMTATRLVDNVAATEGLYALLLLFRVVALQVAAALMLPISAISREATHSWWLLGRAGSLNCRLDSQQGTRGLASSSSHIGFAWWAEWIRMLLLGPWRTPLIAWIGGALLCFQEFETAALLQVDRHPIAWTVWLFDAHAAGESLATSLSIVSRSMLFQLLLLGPAILLLRRGGLNQSHDNQRGRIPNKASNSAAVWLVRLLLCVTAGLICLWPVFTNCRDVVDGFSSLVAQGSFQSRSEQILISVFAATLSSVCALQFSIGLRTFRTQWISLVPILPGLCGALVLSLFLLAAFQLPILHALYDTWIPMLLGQTLLMLPRAFLLVVLLEITSQKLALHSATLMTHSPDLKIARRGRGLIWRLRSLRWLLATAVLTHWSLWDVTTAAILRPTRFEPIVNRLYNEMHYGRTETLVAITAMTLVIPGLAFLAAAIIWRFLPTREQISNG